MPGQEPAGPPRHQRDPGRAGRGPLTGCDHGRRPPPAARWPASHPDHGRSNPGTRHTSPRRRTADADRSPGEPRPGSARVRAAGRRFAPSATPALGVRKSCHSLRGRCGRPGHLADLQLAPARTTATAHSGRELSAGSRTSTDGRTIGAARATTARPAITGQRGGDPWALADPEMARGPWRRAVLRAAATLPIPLQPATSLCLR